MTDVYASRPQDREEGALTLADIKARPVWVCFKIENRNGKMTKPPYNPLTGRGAKQNDPSTWVTYDQAIAAVTGTGRLYTGIGFQFDPEHLPLVGIDLDHCVDPRTGQLARWAQEIVTSLDSYTEISPSGTGVHILLVGNGESLTHHKVLVRALTQDCHAEARIEIYTCGRYFTLTEQRLPGSPAGILPRQRQLLQVYERITAHLSARTTVLQPAASSPDLSDDELIEQAMHAKNSAGFHQLWQGNLGESADPSQADFSLCLHLAFWTGKDPTRMDCLFRRSGLYRPKWDERRGHSTYGELTIAKSIDICKNIYTGRRDAALPAQESPTRLFEHQGQQEADEIDRQLAELDAAIAAQDPDAVLQAVDVLVSLPARTRAMYKRRIRQACGRAIKVDDLDDILKEAGQLQRGTSELIDYGETSRGMAHYTKSGREELLSNFTAKIEADIQLDDGIETNRVYAIRTNLSGQVKRFLVLAREFTRCDWVEQEVGARARICAGYLMKSHLINAIKLCSDPEEQCQYAHTGWQKIDGEMVYLHAGGAISQNGVQANVRLTGSLATYELPESSADLKKAIRASLRFLALGPKTVVFPLYASVWRAVLGKIDFGMHLAGQTGLGKTELVALLQQHFGASMNAQRLPGSWESTENALEILMSQARDALLVVDDFKPRGPKADQDRLHARADRMFRSVGNGAFRARLHANLTQQNERRPGCMLLSTGEDVPRGQSLKARGVVVFLEDSIVAGAETTVFAAQQDARNGLYAQALAGYLAWLAPRIEQLQQQLPEALAAEREALCIAGHARAASNTANLILGMRYFLQFASEVGAISGPESQSYLQQCTDAFLDVAEEAARSDYEERPGEQWRRLLGAAFISKTAHLVNMDGKYPGDLNYGWTETIQDADSADNQRVTLRGGGIQIGWVDGDDIYLNPSAAYKAAKAMGEATGDPLTTLEVTLRKFLVKDGLVATTDLERARHTITVRRRIGNVQYDVLHISKSVFFPDEQSSEVVDSTGVHEFKGVDAPREAKEHGDSRSPDTDLSDAVHSQLLAVSRLLGDTALEGVLQQADVSARNDMLLEHVRRRVTGMKACAWHAPESGFSHELVDPRVYIHKMRQLLMSDDTRHRQIALQEVAWRLT